MTYFQTVANGGAIAHLPNESSASLTTAAQASSSAILQSKAYHRYLPGKSQFVILTTVVGAAVAGVVKRAGYFDASDGIFLEQNGTMDVAWVRRTSTSGSPVDNRIVQSAWNLDKLDGTGPSGFTLNLANTQIVVMDLQWLGSGRVRVGFDLSGVVVYVHEFLNANVLTLPYMKTANLPVRWEIAGNGVATLKGTCASVVSEGGIEKDRGFLFHHASGSVTAADGARTCIVAIRPATTLNSVVNRVQLVLEQISTLVTGATPVLFEILYNPTVTGGSWVAEDATNSAAEYNITATSISGGVDFGAIFNAGAKDTGLTARIDVATRYPVVLDPAGANPISLALVGTGLGAASAVRGSITWRELR
jgi:hypothetical protein